MPIEILRDRNEAVRESVRDFAEFPHRSWLFHKGLVEATSNQTLTVLVRTIADIIELQLTRRYARPMLPVEADKQIRLNLRSIRANDKLIKLLDSRDADGAESYWTRHLIAVGVTVLGDDADAVVDLPG